MPNSLIDFRDWTKTDLEQVLELSFSIEKEKNSEALKNKSAVLLFFESSTRTRMSFELACHRESMNCALMTMKSGSSLDKGESLEDTVMNIAAMDPDLFIIRVDSALNLEQISQKIQQPILNAGWGGYAHPTQALLDIRTLMKKGMKISDIKMLIVGDVKHSRVAHSHFQLSEKLGYQVAVLCPDEFKPSMAVKRFVDLNEGLDWSNAAMMLRFQFERHSEKHADQDFKKYQLSLKKLESWKNRGWLMHPGPVNYGVELDHDVESYSKNVILEQVNSGLWIRRACLRKVLGKK